MTNQGRKEAEFESAILLKCVRGLQVKYQRIYPIYPSLRRFNVQQSMSMRYHGEKSRSR